MTEFKSELTIAPALLKGLSTEESPLQRLYIEHHNEDWEPEYGQIVWSRNLNREVFEIISPVWVTDDFKCGDIVGAECNCSFQDLVWPECVLEDSSLTTLALIPQNAETTPEQIINGLQAILGSSGWICELVEGRLVVAVLPTEFHQRHENEIASALSDKALIQDPGPWCTRFVEATKAGDRARALAEFLIGNGEEKEEVEEEDEEFEEENEFEEEEDDDDHDENAKKEKQSRAEEIPVAA